MATTGCNVWFELMTSDLENAKRFYSEAIGWKPQVWAEGNPSAPYTMWMAGEEAIGGLMALPDDAKKMGAPPNWMAYTTVDDVDRSIEEVKRLGGTVLHPPFDVDKVGRMAVVADPQGAVFAIFKPQVEMGGPDGKKPLQFGWSELNTTDYEAAWKFYSTLFGWTHRSTMQMGPEGPYLMFSSRDEHTKGGISNAAKQMKAPPHWLYYITVTDMDATISRIKRLGGTILNGPMPIPGDDVVAQCRDPQGAVFALYSSHKKS